ncbi:choline ABC transporter ATP-binding protein [Marinomonas sp. 15G1-11]|uniref:Choline ABC transporter ATP-binding protein n=1 Tax=Marinomonas phaeophyticola TaxID=3004091 RepID=A0ABT4JR47_9GAMM|nr:choline ABC transporter ATP-binding protein [Marinomonas sp. 15G1-11]MCZ2720074.1 choline ABC transporter ATP-binding protein [Marinomonas sp. 15G1-11]
MSVVSIQNLDVVFGDNTSKTLALMDEGKSRNEILGLTGDVVGVQNANIEVQEGEICVLMGLSGSGKSTLLRTINGLNKVARGKCLVRDGDTMVDMATCNESMLRHIRTNRVSMVFQSFALMPWLTVLENVAFGLEMQGLGKTERLAKAKIQIDMVGLGNWADKKIDELSGGMRQRVGLARAFAMDSDVLLMDEPFSALDPLIRSQLQDELIELQQRLNKTIIFVSHDLDEALKIGSKIAIMESAKIIQQDKPEEIVLNPATEYVEKFVAHTNPLNVLKGSSLMSSKSEMAVFESGCTDNDLYYYLDATDHILKVEHNGIELGINHWAMGEDINALTVNSVTQVPFNISMRDAAEIRYKTGQPLMLIKDECFVGILNDNNFYHALLGKHFSKSED